MLNTRNGFTLSAAALALVLAGCGGGSGSSDTSSPVSSRQASPSASAADTAAPANALAASLNISARHEKAPNDTQQPVSATGVRGDVLRTMLEQRGCSSPLLPTRGLDGPRIPLEQDDIIPVRAEADLRPDSYVDNPNPPHPMPSTPHFPVGCSAFKLYQPAAGEYTLRASSLAYFQGQTTSYVKRGVNAVHSEIPYSSAGSSTTLGATISIQTRFDQGLSHRYAPPVPNGIPLEEKHQLTASQPFSFQHGSHIGYGELISWAQDDKFQRILLLPGQNANQAKICWHTNMNLVKRLHCKTWTVPEGWQSGQPLKIDDHYVIDDRSPYPNESGLNFWHNKRQR